MVGGFIWGEYINLYHLELLFTGVLQCVGRAFCM